MAYPFFVRTFNTAKTTLNDYLNLIYPITFYPERDGGYTVILQDLPDCIFQGDTLEEAMQNIQDAKTVWLETAFECGDEIPLPSVLWRSSNN
jgi:predicted RNase H-like HicB family nuclease